MGRSVETLYHGISYTGQFPLLSLSDVVFRPQRSLMNRQNFKSTLSEGRTPGKGRIDAILSVFAFIQRNGEISSRFTFVSTSLVHDCRFLVQIPNTQNSCCYGSKEIMNI